MQGKKLYLLGFDCCNYWKANGMIEERVVLFGIYIETYNL